MSDQAPKVVLSLEALYSSVVAEFKDEKIDVPNLFGWRTPPQKIVTGPRITWVPGDLNGDLGAIGAPKYPGRHPRPLATLAELVTVTITGFDETEPEDEFAQYKATRHLLDTWFRAVYHAAFGTFEVRKSGWVIDKKERRHGASIRVLLALDSKMSDRASVQIQGETLGGEFSMSAVERAPTDSEAVPHVTPDPPIEFAKPL